ncbi:MAG: transcription antitermination factor NusB [Deltaproteobacteria bacterium]|nr:transcription antitermination factor NusB [Deltaproteobacteria bacterium]
MNKKPKGSGDASPAGDPPAKGIRRQAREEALKMLYQAEVNPDLNPASKEAWKALKVSARVEDFGRPLVQAVLDHRDALETRLAEALDNWRMDRLPLLTRVLLRMGACELTCWGDTPAAVVLDEAVELAHTFMDEETGRFVNGVLDRLARNARSAADPA